MSDTLGIDSSVVEIESMDAGADAGGRGGPAIDRSRAGRCLGC